MDIDTKYFATESEKDLFRGFADLINDQQMKIAEEMENSSLKRSLNEEASKNRDIIENQETDLQNFLDGFLVRTYEGVSEKLNKSQIAAELTPTLESPARNFMNVKTSTPKFQLQQDQLKNHQIGFFAPDLMEEGSPMKEDVTSKKSMKFPVQVGNEPRKTPSVHVMTGRKNRRVHPYAMNRAAELRTSRNLQKIAEKRPRRVYTKTNDSKGNRKLTKGKKKMTATLESFMNKMISVITGDGRNIVGMMKGFDQTVNVILEESFERVYSLQQGIEQVPLGLYIIRGDNIAVIGEIDDEIDRRLDLPNIKADPLSPIWVI